MKGRQCMLQSLFESDPWGSAKRVSGTGEAHTGPLCRLGRPALYKLLPEFKAEEEAGSFFVASQDVRTLTSVSSLVLLLSLHSSVTLFC